MTLLDLMEVYKLIKNKEDVNALLLDMFQSANIDERIDRTILAGRFLMDCGTREPRYNTTDTFLFFGTVWLQSKAQNISQWLDALDIEYNPLIEYEEHRLEDIDREHITNGTDTKARDVTTTENTTRDTDTTETTSRDVDTTETTSRDVDATETNSRDYDSTESSTLNQTNGDTRTNNFTDEHLVSAENESGVQLRNRDTHTETVGDTATRTESESNTESIDESGNRTESVDESGNRTESVDESASKTARIDEDITNTRRDTTTHDDTVDTTLTGRKTAAYDLIIKEMEKAKLNIYDSLIDDFADVMFLNVF